MKIIKKILKAINIKEYYKKLNDKTELFEPTFVITLTLLFAFIVIGSMKSIMGETTVEIAGNKAEEYFYNGKYDEAISTYEKMQIKEEWPGYKLKIAEIYSLKGNYEKSNNLLKESVIIRNRLIESEGAKYVEKDREFINDVVFTFYMNGELEEAITLGEDYLKNVNNYRPLIQTLFSVYLSSGQTDRAEALIANYPLDEESSYDISNFSKMQMMLGNFEDGLMTLEKAWKKNKNEINIFDVISEVSYYNRDEIVKKLTELSEENPNEDLYKLLIAKIYASSNETAKVAGEIINSVDDEVSFVNVSIIKAQAYFNENKSNEATKTIKKVIESKEDSFMADYLEAWLYYRNEDYLQAYEYAKKSLITNANYDNTWGTLMSEIMIALEKSDVADVYFRTALAKDPINYDMIIKVAEYYKNTKLDYDMAKRYYSLALGISQEKEEIYYSLASMELLRENYEEAVEYLESSVDIKPNDGKYYRNLGYVYLQLGKNEKAIESFREAYSLNEKDVLSLNNAACYYINIENDIWRGYANIEAAYNEMPADLDEESKLIIEENYKQTAKILEQYVEDEETILNIPELSYFK